MKEGRFQKWRRRFSESLLRLGSSTGRLENRSPSRSPSNLLSNTTSRPRSLVSESSHLQVYQSFFTLLVFVHTTHTRLQNKLFFHLPNYRRKTYPFSSVLPLSFLCFTFAPIPCYVGMSRGSEHDPTAARVMNRTILNVEEKETTFLVHTVAIFLHMSLSTVQSLQQVDMVTDSRERTSTISGPAYASVGPSFMHHVAVKNFGSTGNLVSRPPLGRRSSLGPVCT